MYIYVRSAEGFLPKVNELYLFVQVLSVPDMYIHYIYIYMYMCIFSHFLTLFEVRSAQGFLPKANELYLFVQVLSVSDMYIYIYILYIYIYMCLYI